MLLHTRTHFFFSSLYDLEASNNMSPRSASVLLFLSALICASFTGGATTSQRPSGVVLKVRGELNRETTTILINNIYTTEIEQATPLQKKRVVVDLGGDQVWVQCGGGTYNSSTFRPVGYPSAVCSAAQGGYDNCLFRPREIGCINNTCGKTAFNSLTLLGLSGQVGQDVLALSSTVKVPRFTFTCAPSDLLFATAQGIVGMAGLGKARVSLPSLLSAAFAFPRRFAICLPSASAPGALLFGKVPYLFLPGVDVFHRLTYTPILKSPDNFPSRYFISVTAIRVGEKNVAINSTKLKIDSQGFGGTVLTTAVKYTTVERSVYTAIRDAFVKEAEAMKISRVAAVTPFDACFDATTVRSSRVGPAVPAIDLVFQNSKTMWRITGANSMVQVSEGVLCLAIVEAEEWRVSTIIIGGHQMQDNLLHFDLATSRLGFSNTLLGVRTTCSNFNFTSTA